MPANIKDILSNIKDIYMTDSSLETLLDYERVLDELDLYSFKHWKLGELVEGPVYEKYFVTCTWMFPYRKMPDPSGGRPLAAAPTSARAKARRRVSWASARTAAATASPSEAVRVRAAPSSRA